MYRHKSPSKGGIYRSRKGILLGVCRGLGEYFDFSVFWIRATAVILFIFTGFWPVVGIYILAALLMKSEPADHSSAGCRAPGGSRSRWTRDDAAARLKRKWEHLERRIRKMEAKVTSREFDWNSRFHGN
jgi:phage shock protein C